MQKFRTLPVEIEAMQWDGTAAGATTIIDWILSSDGTAIYVCCNPSRCAEFGGDAPHAIQIRALEGPVTAWLNDYVIKGVEGGFRPCKPDIFAKKYAPAPVREYAEIPEGGQSAADWIRTLPRT